MIPSSYYQKKYSLILKNTQNDNYIMGRVNYYNKLSSPYTTTEKFKTIDDFFKYEKRKTYFFDLAYYLKYFNKHNKIAYLFGDITTVPDTPAILKSRPITGDNRNSILMKLNKVRHFIFVNDTIKFEDKKEMLVWRGKAHQPHRKIFLKKFYTHPLCDVGQIIKNKDKNPEAVQWVKEKLSLKKQLEYKFILALEGNDVASNLKWAMSSNSLVFMTKPEYETWFMEGTLIPNYHYVLLEDDYSNLEQQIEYFSQNTQEALKIIQNAHAHVEQFKDEQREDIISLLVLKKYFEMNKNSVN